MPAAAWLADEPWNDYGLNQEGNELRLVRRTGPQRDFQLFILSALGLPARVEKPPFSNEVRLRVASSAGVNVRLQPGMDKEIIGTLSEGTAVTVIEDAEGRSVAYEDVSDPQPPSYRATPWLYVRTESGLQGWVRSNLLIWE